MGFLKRIELEGGLKDELLMTGVKEDVFLGYTTELKTDIDGNSHKFKVDEGNYYKVFDVLEGSVFMSQDKLIDILVKLPEMDYLNGDTYAHGYPEARLVPSNHESECEESIVDKYVSSMSKLLRSKIEYMISDEKMDNNSGEMW